MVQCGHIASSVQAVSESQTCRPPAKLLAFVRAYILVKSFHASSRPSILVSLPTLHAAPLLSLISSVFGGTSVLNVTMSTSTPSFLVGTAISVYQNSGGKDTNWSEFELKRTGNGKPTIKGGVTCGSGANFWELYEEDIERAASLKLNSFRLSIEWNRIEPNRGKIDEAGIARYHQIFDCLHRCYLHAITITPTAC